MHFRFSSLCHSIALISFLFSVLLQTPAWADPRAVARQKANQIVSEMRFWPKKGDCLKDSCCFLGFGALGYFCSSWVPLAIPFGRQLLNWDHNDRTDAANEVGVFIREASLYLLGQENKFIVSYWKPYRSSFDPNWSTMERGEQDQQTFPEALENQKTEELAIRLVLAAAGGGMNPDGSWADHQYYTPQRIIGDLMRVDQENRYLISSEALERDAINYRILEGVYFLPTRDNSI